MKLKILAEGLASAGTVLERQTLIYGDKDNNVDVVPLAGRYGETGLSGRLSEVSDLAGLARGGADGAWLRETGRR